MFIYKITNQLNSKFYIGQSINPISERFHRHLCDANRLDTHLARAIRKYGPEAFSIECIDTATNQKKLTAKEIYWIQKLDAINSGYNETDAIYKCGGNTYRSKTTAEMDLIKEKIRQTKSGDKNPRAETVIAINLQTKEVFEFGSMCECARELGFSNHVCISKRCLGKITKPYKGIWNFKLKETVSTIPDECKGVGSEISTESKRKATE